MTMEVGIRYKKGESRLYKRVKIGGEWYLDLNYKSALGRLKMYLTKELDPTKPLAQIWLKKYVASRVDKCPIYDEIIIRPIKGSEFRMGIFGKRQGFQTYISFRKLHFRWSDLEQVLP